MDGGAWWATVHGVAKSWTRLSDFTKDHREPTPKKKKKKDALFIRGDWKEKVGTQEIPGVTGKFALE